MHRTLQAVLGIAVALATAGGRVRADPDLPQYVLYDLGAGTAAGIDSGGRVAVNVVVGVGLAAHSEASIRSVGAGGAVTSTPVLGLATGNGAFRASAMASDGAVAGTSNVWAPTWFGSCVPTGEQETRDRAVRGGAGGTVNLGRLVFPAQNCSGGVDEDLLQSGAYDVSATGIAVGYSARSIGGSASVFTYAVKFEGGQVTALAAQGDTDASVATAVDSAGRAVGARRTGSSAFRMKLWAQGAEHDIDVADTLTTSPADMNDAGQIVGNRQLPGPLSFLKHAFLTTLSGTSVASDVELLPLAGGTYARAEAINASGVVVGASEAPTPGVTHAVIWSGTTPVDLNGLLDGASPGLPTDGSTLVLNAAEGINAAGEVACTGSLNGDTTAPRAYLLRPVTTAGVTVKPGVADFGNVIQGDVQDLKVTVKNGTASRVKVRLSKPPKPFVLKSSPVSFTIAPGASKVVTLRLDTRKLKVGPVAGQMSVVTPDATIPVPVQAQVVAPPEALFLTPMALDFGHVFFTAHRTVTVHNLEDEPVVAYLSCAKPFSVVASVSLGPKAHADVDVACAFAGEGTYEGTLVATTKLPLRSASTVGLGGVGVAAARVVRISGEVATRRSDADWHELKLGQELTADDEIFTGVESGVLLEFPDGGRFEVRELTQLLIGTVVFKANRKDVAVRLKVGEINAQVKKEKVVDTNFEVQTPTATTSVRGTQFLVRHETSTATTTVGVLESSVLVTPSNAELEPVIVPAGKMVIVTPTSVSPLLDFAGANVVVVAATSAGALLRRGAAGDFDVPLEVGVEVVPGDAVRTGTGGGATLVAPDATTFALDASSEAEFTGLSAQFESRSFEVRVVRGRFRAAMGSASKKAVKLSVSSPTAAIDRYTCGEFDVAYDEGSQTTTVRAYGPGLAILRPTAFPSGKKGLAPRRMRTVTRTTVSPAKPF